MNTLSSETKLEVLKNSGGGIIHKYLISQCLDELKYMGYKKIELEYNLNKTNRIDIYARKKRKETIGVECLVNINNKKILEKIKRYKKLVDKLIIAYPSFEKVDEDKYNCKFIKIKIEKEYEKKFKVLLDHFVYFELEGLASELKIPYKDLNEVCRLLIGFYLNKNYSKIYNKNILKKEIDLKNRIISKLEIKVENERMHLARKIVKYENLIMKNNELKTSYKELSKELNNMQEKVHALENQLEKEELTTTSKMRSKYKFINAVKGEEK